jgi:hypothetical protein
MLMLAALPISASHGNVRKIEIASVLSGLEARSKRHP